VIEPERLQGFSARLQPLFTLVLIGCVVGYGIYSWQWPLVGDAPLFHYIVFLIRSGSTPYRDFLDINLPGTYAVHAFVIATLGAGAHAWRMFDFALLAAIGLGIAIICKITLRSGWIFPSLFAAAIFALIHGRDGIIQQGQRDLILAALLMLGYAALIASFESEVPKERHWQTLISGILIGSACTIKPFALILLPALALLFAFHRRRAGRAYALHLAAFLGGATLPLAAVLAYLLQANALSSFLDVIGTLVPLHASLQRESLPTLLVRSVSSVCLPLFLLWLVILTVTKRKHLFSDQALVLAFLFGVFSFCLQGRGYTYHRYPSEAFLLLSLAITLTSALKQHQPRWIHGLCLAGFVFGSLIVAPRSLAVLSRYDPSDQFGVDLQADLARLGGSSMNHQVQCLDLASGCLATLQRMQLIQATGFLYDCYLYSEPESPRSITERERYRTRFIQEVTEHPPQLFIITSDNCHHTQNYDYAKLHRFPWLENDLAEHYTLIEDHIPAGLVRWNGKPQPPIGYRIYRLR
jgi:hypothetical protein